MTQQPPPTGDRQGPADRPAGGGEKTLEVQALYRLLDVSRRLNAEVNPDSVLAQIVDSLVTLTRADRGFLMLRRADGTLAFAIARDKNGKPLEETRFKVSQSVVNEVAQSGVTRLIDDAASSDAYQARMSIIALSLRTVMCVPLKTQQGVIGVIYVDSNAITRRFSPNDVPLVEAFAAQAAATLERVRLQRAELERDRLQSQLDTAAEIQRTFLPSTFPDIEGVTGAVASVPALDVGGDFYDVIRLPRGRVGVIVGDVSGKGVPGALFGARLMSDVRYEALYHDDVAATLTALNRIVAQRATRGMFVTFVYAVIDPKTGEVVVGNAGHLKPIVRDAGGHLSEWEDPKAPPLGILPDLRYAAAAYRLERGQTLLLLSDGIIDAERDAGDRFGEDRVTKVVESGPGDPAGLIRAVLDATATFGGKRPQADDQTLLAVSLR
jgi:sigma-B regulation protein RsbU (phosphoserine phosphatase)